MVSGLLLQVLIDTDVCIHIRQVVSQYRLTLTVGVRLCVCINEPSKVNGGVVWGSARGIV